MLQNAEKISQSKREREHNWVLFFFFFLWIVVKLLTNTLTYNQRLFLNLEKTVIKIVWGLQNYPSAL